VSAGRPRWVPSLGTQGHLATSGQCGAALRALFTDLPQNVLDVRAIDDQAEVSHPEAEAFANAGATASLAIALRQTTLHTLRSRSDVDVGRAPGDDSAPEASELPPTPSTRAPIPSRQTRQMILH